VYIDNITKKTYKMGVKSFKSIMLSVYLRSKKMTDKGATEELKENTDKMHYEIEKDIKFPRSVTKKLYKEMEVFESSGDGKSELTFMYIHGGVYCHQFSKFHWNFLANIAERTGCAFITPNYPMIPKYTYKESFPMVIDFYKEFIKNNDMNKVIIGGDCAGSGLVLSLLQQAKLLGLPLPIKMVLLSPYVDITGAVEREEDSMLEKNALLVYGKAWANELDLKDPRVSPLNGDMKGLPKTFLWVGTWEILYEECIKAYEKMKDSGVEVELHVGEKMGHVYPLYPISEADEAREKIAKFILN